MIVRRGIFFCMAALALSVACVKPSTTTARSFTDDEIRYAGYLRSLYAAEPGILRALIEKDARIYERFSPRAVDSSGWQGRDYQSPVAFGDREAAITEANELFESAWHDELSFEGGGLRLQASLRTAALDQEILRRLIKEESERLVVERESPRAALTLIRAMNDAWPMSVDDPDDLDKWITYALGELQKELKPGVFSEAERDTMRVDLAALASHFGRTPHAREAAFAIDKVLVNMLTSPYAVRDSASLEKELRTFVDERARFDALEPDLDDARDSLRIQIDAAMSVLDAPHRQRVLATAAVLLVTPPTCAVRLPIRTPRDMAPPPERALACSLVRALAGAVSDEDELAALVALYDATTVGAWSVMMHGRSRDPVRAMTGRALMSPLSQMERAVILRDASAKPSTFIAVGLATALLVDRGGGHAKSRAASWRAFGETPVDIAAAVLVDRR
jgi:hypothetical protein